MGIASGVGAAGEASHPPSASSCRFRSPTDRWEQEGSSDLFERSHAWAREILAGHYPNYFGAKQDAEIRARFPIKLDPAEMKASSGRW